MKHGQKLLSQRYSPVNESMCMGTSNQPPSPFVGGIVTLRGHGSAAVAVGTRAEREFPSRRVAQGLELAAHFLAPAQPMWCVRYRTAILAPVDLDLARKHRGQG